MSKVAVPVLKPLTYQGRSYVRGEMMTVEAVEALAMKARGEVTLTRGTVVEPDKAPELDQAPEPDPTRRRRTYRRRDMTAETAEPVAE